MSELTRFDINYLEGFHISLGIQKYALQYNRKEMHDWQGQIEDAWESIKEIIYTKRNKSYKREFLTERITTKDRLHRIKAIKKIFVPEFMKIKQGTYLVEHNPDKTKAVNLKIKQSMLNAKLLTLSKNKKFL